MQDFDLVVIGAGVAGLTAAMTAARHGLTVMVVDQMGPGGQIANAEKIENFPGLLEGIAGFELGPLLQEQAEAAGAGLMLDTAEALERDGERHIVRGAAEVLRAPAVIVAAGSAQRALGVPGEARLLGKGVSHCASCDGAFFRGQEVGVIGGGDAALDEALVLTEHAAKVTLFHRGPHLDAQAVLAGRIDAAPKIEVILNTEVIEIAGEDAVTGMRLRDAQAGTERVHPLGGVFVYIGQEPNTAFLQGMLRLDNAGHIETDILMRTSLDGVFAAGDIRAHSVAQLAAVAGDGATAAVAAVRYVRSTD